MPKEGSEEGGEQELKGVYIISVAARLLEMHPQTLRKYERLGLVSPSRTIGMLRLYSEEDIQKLRLIRYLEETLGLNLAGVEFTLNLLNHLLEMQQRLTQMVEAEEFFGDIEREMARLFRNLNLPRQV
jgi:MerR family transcriptional regulator/heat shock protein HspR